MNTKVAFYKLSLASKAFLVPLYFGKKEIPFKPSFVSLEVEDGCNLRCLHCDLWKRRKNSRRMNLRQMKKAVGRLKKWLGFFWLHFTGGEPFLGKDTLSLIKHASDLGLFVETNSNGFLIDEKLCQRIVGSGLNRLSISLDSLNPQVHNRLRGNPQGYKRAVRALKLFSRFEGRSRPFLSVTTIIMEPTVDCLEDLVYWVQKRGIDAIYFQALWQNFGARYNQDWFKKNPLWPKNYKKAKKILDRLIELKKKDYPIGNSLEKLEGYKSYFQNPGNFGKQEKCFVGVNNFAIDIAGDVRLCFNFPPIGNILKEKPEEIWSGKEAQRQRLKVACCQCGCKVLLCNGPMTRKETLALLVNKATRFLK